MWGVFCVWCTCKQVPHMHNVHSFCIWMHTNTQAFMSVHIHTQCPSPPEPSLAYQGPSSLSVSLSCTQTVIKTHACLRLLYAQAAALRAGGCNQTLHLYVHHVPWERHWNKESKTCLHTCKTHTVTNVYKKCPSVDQNSCLPSPLNQYPHWSTDSRNHGREAPQVHTCKHTHMLMCMMASAASLLTLHMLTEAYTSLLVVLTVWVPTERERERGVWTETDKPVIDRKGKAEVTHSKKIA